MWGTIEQREEIVLSIYGHFFKYMTLIILNEYRLVAKEISVKIYTLIIPSLCLYNYCINNKNCIVRKLFEILEYGSNQFQLKQL